MKDDPAYICSMGYPALTILAEKLYDLADGGSTELFGIGYLLEAMAEKMKKVTDEGVA